MVGQRSGLTGEFRLVTKVRGGMQSSLVDFGEAFDLIRVKVMIAGQMGPIRHSHDPCFWNVQGWEPNPQLIDILISQPTTGRPTVTLFSQNAWRSWRSFQKDVPFRLRISIWNRQANGDRDDFGVKVARPALVEFPRLFMAGRRHT